MLKAHLACYSCLESNHLSIDCPVSKRCGIDNCDLTHHLSLHSEQVSGNNNSVKEDSSNCFLPIMPITVRSKVRDTINVFWDSGSTVSLIRNAVARVEGKTCHDENDDCEWCRKDD